MLAVGDPFERIHDAQPLTSVEIPRSTPPHRPHATGRDELVFINKNSELEVYRIDPSLTRLRTVPILLQGASEFKYVTALPNSPRAVVSGSKVGLFMVNTETGQVERDFNTPDAAGGAIVSPDERWLVLEWPRILIDLRNEVRADLPIPISPIASVERMSFVGNDSLFAPWYAPAWHELWNLPTRQTIWSFPGHDRDAVTYASVSDGSRIITGDGSTCRVWDVETGRVIRSHNGSRTAWAVALHPHNGDYIAGYSTHSYTLTYELGGKVRIWNAEGERLTTFPAHPESRYIKWIAVSKTGDYLVTSDGNSVKVWDYHALTRR